MKQDVQIFNLIKKEEDRQTSGIELIASENYVSDQVLEALGSICTNKYPKDIREQDTMADVRSSIRSNSWPSTDSAKSSKLSMPMCSRTPEHRRTWL